MIVSRCSLKYIKDQTSCERGRKGERERERESKRGRILPLYLKFRDFQGIWASAVGAFNSETMSL